MEQNFLSQTALDQITGSDTTQLLKAAVPYLPPKAQQFFSVYAKARELSNTINTFSGQKQDSQLHAASLNMTDPLDALNDIRRFCYGKSRQQLDQILNTMAIFQMAQLMK